MKQYSFTKVDLIVDNEVVTGFAESAGIITVQRSATQHNKVMDAKGAMNVATSGDLSGTITFNILQTSDWNNKMHAKATLAQSVGTAPNSNTFEAINASIQDKMGGVQAEATTGYIPKVAGVVRGNGIATKAWTIMFEKVSFSTAQEHAVVF